VAEAELVVRWLDELDKRLGDAIAFAWARRRRSIVVRGRKGRLVNWLEDVQGKEASPRLASFTRAVTSLYLLPDLIFVGKRHSL